LLFYIGRRRVDIRPAAEQTSTCVTVRREALPPEKSHG